MGQRNQPILESGPHVSFKLPEYELTGTVATLVRRVLSGVSNFDREVAEELFRCFGVAQASTLCHYPGRAESAFAFRRDAKSAIGGGFLGYYGKIVDNDPDTSGADFEG